MEKLIKIISDFLETDNVISLEKKIFHYLPEICNLKNLYLLLIGTKKHILTDSNFKKKSIENIDILTFEKEFLFKDFIKLKGSSLNFLDKKFNKETVVLLPIINNQILKNIIILINPGCNDEIFTFLTRLFNNINEKIFYKDIFHKKDYLYGRIFNKINSTIILRDKNFNIIFANKEIKDSYKCFEIVFKYNSPCSFCPLKQKTITQKINNKYYKIEQTLLENNTLCIIEDISPIINLKNELTKAEKLSFLGKVSSEITHEIKNPLNAIQLKLTLLENILNSENLVSEKIKKILTNINSEISRLSNIANDFLQFGKNVFINKMEFNLKDFLEEILNDFNPLFLKENIKIKFYYNKNHGYKFSGDKDKIKQAIINLVKNSIEELSKFNTKNKSIIITLDKERGNFKIEIKDSGGGISNKDNLFNPFYTTKSYGTGLGLSITKKNIEAHNGKLSYKREEGFTIFTIYLPEK